LHQVAHTIAGQTAFAQRPKWQGQCAETGAWTCDTPAVGLSSGALAKALTQLAPQDTAGASLLGKAFDACVECQVSPVASAEPFNA
jgi:hypothetical protein